MTDMRRIIALPMPNLEKSELPKDKPELSWAKPSDLYIEAQYQRDISKRSITLIRRIVSGWDWSKFKPPVCAENKGKLFVVDGQHTAIAAASRDDIEKIPVIIVSNLTIQERAEAFIGHNRDRLPITPMQMHYSALAAGDPVAVALDEAATKAKVKILKYPPAHGIFKPNDLMCIGVASKITKDKGANGCYRAFRILARAKRAPITAPELKAVSRLLWGKASVIVDELQLVTIIQSKTIREWRFAADMMRDAEEENMSVDMALSILWKQEIKCL